MSSGGGGGGNTTTTTSNIPEWLQDPTKRMVARGEALTGPKAQFQQYQGQRVAGMTDAQNQAMSGVQGLGNPSQYGVAQQNLMDAQNMANGAAAAGAGYQPGQFSGQGYGAAQLGPTQNFDANAAQQYMSPYQQGVTNIASREALMHGQQAQNALSANASRNGAFGGSRFGLEQAQQERNLGMQLNDIQTQGLQSAYGNAQQQFNTDQNRSMQAGLANQGATNQAAMFGAQQGMTAQQLGEQSRQFGNDAGLRGADLAARTGLSAAAQNTALGAQSQSDALARANALAGFGAQQQSLNQQNLNNSYDNFVNARDYERNNLQFMSGLLRGNPVSTRSDVVTPAPSFASQAGGLGLAGLGAYKAFGGG